MPKFLRRFLLTAFAALSLSHLFAPAALAGHAAAPDPHQRFGFDSAGSIDSGFCLQCHDIHGAAGDFALMWQNSVTNTCATCHGIYLSAPAGARGPDNPRRISGPAASTSAYKVSPGDRLEHEGHRLGLNLNGPVPFTYASGPGTNGEVAPFTAASPDFIPGSGYPGIRDYKYLNRIDRWLSFVTNQDMSNFPASSRTALGGLYCAGCHSVHGSERGSALPGTLTKNKLLSSTPNHQQAPIDTAGWTRWSKDGWRFCEGCHPERSEAGAPDGAAPHNHSSSFCLECHGDNPAASPDFPHTGTANLLAAYPDELCVSACHAFSLP